MPGNDACTERRLAEVVDHLAREEAQEVALARAVRSEHTDALAEHDVRRERFDDSRKGERLGGDDSLPGPPAVEADGHALVLRPLAGRGLLVATELRVRCPETRRERVRHL